MHDAADLAGQLGRTEDTAARRDPLTYGGDWTGFPAIAPPPSVGPRSVLATSVSLVGAPGAEWDHLLAWGTTLQAELGTVPP